MGQSSRQFTAERSNEANGISVNASPAIRTMYNIRIDHLNIIQAIEDNDGMLDEDIEKALVLTEAEFQDKAISYGFVIKSFDDTTEIIEKEIARLKLLQKRAVNRSELFKQRLDEAMRQFHFEKIKTPTLTLLYRKRKSVEITDETLIPDIFKITPEPVISKTLIKVALDEGGIVPGAQFIEKKSLEIK